MIRPFLLGSVLLLANACGIHDRTEYRWTGPLTAAKPGPQCPPTKGVLILRAGVVTFAPDEGVWVLSGAGGPKTLTATRSRPTSDHKIYKTDLQADWTDASVHGTYTTPDCTYHLDLARF